MYVKATALTRIYLKRRRASIGCWLLRLDIDLRNKGRDRDDHVEVFRSIESKIFSNLSIVAEIDPRKKKLRQQGFYTREFRVHVS